MIVLHKRASAREFVNELGSNVYVEVDVMICKQTYKASRFLEIRSRCFWDTEGWDKVPYPSKLSEKDMLRWFPEIGLIEKWNGRVLGMQLPDEVEEFFRGH